MNAGKQNCCFRSSGWDFFIRGSWPLNQLQGSSFPFLMKFWMRPCNGGEGGGLCRETIRPTSVTIIYHIVTPTVNQSIPFMALSVIDSSNLINVIMSLW